MALLAKGSATAKTLSDVRGSKRSMFADPAAWLVAAAVEDAIEGMRAELTAAASEVGVICVSRHCTVHTISAIGRGVPDGRVSPMRFAGANPGAMSSLPCILFGFGGPTLVFTMDPEAAAPAVASVARAWLRDGSARYVLVCSHTAGAEGHVTRCEVLGPGA
ncbi:hypothetical protein [Amycolatopsis sp. NPDC051716]|jgi:hypothetical protein|uniref:hypothetical protein n=1 Tax=Amycolatopsis sp. NPDC051716 TaxID=3155804 RepID=UPI003438A21C